MATRRKSSTVRKTGTRAAQSSKAPARSRRRGSATAPRKGKARSKAKSKSRRHPHAAPLVSVIRRPGKRRRSLSHDDRQLAWALKQVGLGGFELSSLAAGGGRKGRNIAAKYDAARTTSDNARHWSMADNLSADAAASHAVRQVLRNRARYEVANNSYAQGIVNTLADDTIGTGPRLRVDLADTETNRLIEREFKSWCDEVGLADHLRLMRKARVHDGEAFGVMVTNETLRHRVKLDLLLIEADQVTSPDMMVSADNVDGVLLNESGRPRGYQVRKTHPGANLATSETYTVAAESMLHWFRANRPGQHRGLPELMAALGLFAQLRRYTLAVLEAAELAADFAILLHTSHPADDECDYIKPMDTFDVERGMVTTLPEGWDATQFKGEQPTTTYEVFVRALLREIARCLGMPYCIAAGDSSGYNFASGRLDHKTYYKAIRIDQEACERLVLNRLLRVWVREAALAGVIPAVLSGEEIDLPHQWFWDGDQHVDPVKESVAITELLSNGATGLPEVFAGFGQDWRVEMAKNAEAFGLSLDEYRRRLVDKLLGPASPASPSSAERARTLAQEDDAPADAPADTAPAARSQKQPKEAAHAAA